MTAETKLVRVTRTSTVERVETVELSITRQKGEYSSHARIAEELVKAGIKAGQPMNWTLVSEEIKSWPSAPDIEATEPAEESPAPLQEVA